MSSVHQYLCTVLSQVKDIQNSNEYDVYLVTFYNKVLTLVNIFISTNYEQYILQNLFIFVHVR